MHTWQTFGRELIVSEDLDPVYTMLAEAEPFIGEHLLKRFLLAYWCYYNSGVSARIAEADDFYIAMWQGVEERWPRGMERRYFWGKTAIGTIEYLQAWGEPEAIVDRMTIHTTFRGATEAIQSFKGFGPWMGWKVADMAERVLHIPVSFEDSTLGIYKDPMQGAALIVFGDWKHPITDDELAAVVGEQEIEFADLLAPPYYDRPTNIQEVETNLCKFKAHVRGFYPMGNDTYHLRASLDGWGDVAQELLRWVPHIKPGHKGYGNDH